MRNTTYEVIDNRTGRRCPKAIFKRLSSAKKYKKERILRLGTFKGDFFIYKTWTEDGTRWGESLD